MDRMTGAYFRALRTYLGYSITELVERAIVNVWRR